MKKIVPLFILTLICCICFTAKAQETQQAQPVMVAPTFSNKPIQNGDSKPIHWVFSAKKIGPKQAEITIRATVEKGWHLFSMDSKPGGPVKTSFTFQTSKDYSVSGAVTEPKPIKHFDKTFKMDVTYFENVVNFKQRVKLNSSQAKIKGIVEFMVGYDSKALPPDQTSFSIDVK